MDATKSGIQPLNVISIIALAVLEEFKIQLDELASLDWLARAFLAQLMDEVSRKPSCRMT